MELSGFGCGFAVCKFSKKDFMKKRTDSLPFCDISLAGSDSLFVSSSDFCLLLCKCSLTSLVVSSCFDISVEIFGGFFGSVFLNAFLNFSSRLEVPIESRKRKRATGTLAVYFASGVILNLIFEF